ncbi:endospore germination permease [Paenibacillus thailandensis]|uniref:Endospore germination permease n=1 Tax=Paenibacillus thailandensis TaxID=393250 RepID=A0ABW5R0G3_9BACL
MLEKEKISLRQFSVLALHFTVGTTVLIGPSGLAAVAKQDGWLAGIVGLCANLLSVLLYSALGNRFPDKTFAEYTELLLGKWLGKAVSLLFFSYIFLLTAFLLRVLGNFLTTHIMPETPIEAILIVFVCLVVLAVRLGLETISRAAEMFLPLIVFLFLFLVAFLTPQIKTVNLLPVFEEGAGPVLLASFYFFSLQELVVLLMLFPYANRTLKARKAWLQGVAIGGMMLVIITALSILVLGPDLTARDLYPSFELAKRINVANFLQRVEAALAILWLVTIFFKTAVCFYAGALTLAQTLQLKDYRPLTFPLAMIAVVLSIVVYHSIVDFLEFVPKVWSVYAMTYIAVIPLILLMTAAVRKK